MPDVNEYEDEGEWMKVCIPKMIEEGKDQEQAAAVCMSIWTHRNDSEKAVKAVDSWELDVLGIPFNKKDSDRQWFDAETDIMPETFTTPLVVYQHGIARGAKELQEKLIVVGKAKAGTLERRSDGWHIRVVLDKSTSAAKRIMEAAKNGMIAVSSGSISHLARLDIGNKVIPYEKDRPGRITVWPFAELSLWEKGNGNVSPANSFAVAMPVMKAIYREAGVLFPAIKKVNDTYGVLHDAKRAKVLALQEKSKKLLEKIERKK